MITFVNKKYKFKKMRVIVFVVELLFTISVGVSLAREDKACVHKTTCKDCFAAGPSCTWCSDPNFPVSWLIILSLFIIKRNGIYE